MVGCAFHAATLLLLARALWPPAMPGSTPACAAASFVPESDILFGDIAALRPPSEFTDPDSDPAAGMPINVRGPLVPDPDSDAAAGLPVDVRGVLVPDPDLARITLELPLLLRDDAKL
jgi:hypothetical protein